LQDIARLFEGDVWIFVAGVVIALVNSMNEDRKVYRRTTVGLFLLRTVYMSVISVSLFGLMRLWSPETLTSFALVFFIYGAWRALEKL
jgi:CHASE2 domain-containing sensor protein